MHRILGLTLAIGVTALIGSGSAFAVTTLDNHRSHGAQLDRQAPATLQDQPVLVELFTSQGCSSCPPADKVAAELVNDPDLVVVSRPVTYWDRLGWEDTLAKPANTELQRAYARQGLAGRNGVYTPQIVVDGLRGTVGSNLAQVRQFVRQSKGASAAITTRPISDGSVAVGYAGTAPREAELVLVALDASETVKIGRGENGGRSVTYTNVLKSEERLATWTGGTEALRIPAAQINQPGANRYALILREKNAGPILAAHNLPRS